MNTDRFKFRVWHEKCQEYIERDCNECSIRFDGRLVAGVCVDDGYAGRYDYYEQADVIIEQCTGIKDKNGKLIYEGDIVCDRGEIEPVCDMPLVVKWSDRLCRFIFDADKIGMRAELSSIDGAKSHNYEIIGNIHTTDKDK